MFSNSMLNTESYATVFHQRLNYKKLYKQSCLLTVAQCTAPLYEIHADTGRNDETSWDLFTDKCHLNYIKIEINGQVSWKKTKQWT